MGLIARRARAWRWCSFYLFTSASRSSARAINTRSSISAASPPPRAPGFNFYPAFFYRVGRKVNMMEQVIDIPGQEIITKDNAMISTDGVVFFQVLDAAKAAYEVSRPVRRAAAADDDQPAHRDGIDGPRRDAVEARRDQRAAAHRSSITRPTPWGVKITRVEIKDIRPPADIVNAMGRQMKAEREKRANILDAEGARASEILRAEGQKQARILEAEGRKEVGVPRRRGARARRRGGGERRPGRCPTRSKSGGTQAINYFIAQKYVEAIGKFATSPNAKTILFPVEATQLIGTLGGIGELAKEALGDATSPTTAAPSPTASAGRSSCRKP